MAETKLILTPSGFKTWKVWQDFKQETSIWDIEVPKGTETDLASIPRFLWCLLPPFGRYSQAAVIHDYLYSTEGTGVLSRKDSDNIFYELMIRYGTYKWKAKLMYFAVRIFGRLYWK